MYLCARGISFVSLRFFYWLLELFRLGYFLFFILLFRFYFVITAPGTPPKNVVAHPVSPVTVLVEWDAPEKPNGIIQV